MEKMSLVYNAKDQERISHTSLTNSQFVAVCTGDPPAWFRGRVLSYSENNSQVLVQLLDYGATVSLPVTCIQPLW